jgi:hypothetical protein
MAGNSQDVKTQMAEGRRGKKEKKKEGEDTWY